MIVVAIFFVIAVIVLLKSVVVLKGQDRGVIFRLGRPFAVVGPGMALTLPFVDSLTRVSLAEQELRGIQGEVQSGDGTTSNATARLVYRIVDPLKSVTAVHNLQASLLQLTATTLRQVPFEPGATREFTSAVERKLDEVTQSWGVKIITIEIDRQRF